LVKNNLVEFVLKFAVDLIDLIEQLSEESDPVFQDALKLNDGL